MILSTNSRRAPAISALVLLAVVSTAVALIFGPVQALQTLAGVVLATVAALALRRFGQGARVLADSQREALTDQLTGLGNRRKLLEDLSDALSDSRASSPRRLMLLDLDGFKRYNDSFGHPAGDVLLARLGGRLDASVAPTGTAYRLGGDEFCVLIPDGPNAQALCATAVEALSEHGEGFTVGASSGTVGLPLEADTPDMALHVADQRLYVEKDSRRTSGVHAKARQVLAHVLHGRVPDFDGHLEGVPKLVHGVARALGLAGETLDVAVRAGELHDIGMLSIPDVVRDKPAPLDALEWEIVCQHTLVGERILSTERALLPVASLVRATHERWDGTGYPDAVAGDEIPLGARIVHACVAYEAMRSQRPYRAARSQTAALAELRRYAGSQFDPQVVSALCDLIDPNDPSATDRQLGQVAAGRQSGSSSDRRGRSTVQETRTHGGGGIHRKGSRQ